VSDHDHKFARAGDTVLLAGQFYRIVARRVDPEALTLRPLGARGVTGDRLVAPDRLHWDDTVDLWTTSGEEA